MGGGFVNSVPFAVGGPIDCLLKFQGFGYFQSGLFGNLRERRGQMHDPRILIRIGAKMVQSSPVMKKPHSSEECGMKIPYA